MLGYITQDLAAARTGAKNFDISFYFTDADIEAMSRPDAATHIIERAAPAFPEANLQQGLTSGEWLPITGTVSKETSEQNVSLAEHGIVLHTCTRIS